MEIKKRSFRNRHWRDLRCCTAMASALATLTFATAATAQDECGAAVDGVVACLPAGNPYPDGITYDSPADDLTVLLAPGVALTSSADGAGVTVSGNTSAIAVRVSGGAAISTSGYGATGIAVTTGTGAITINNAGSIETTGARARGIYAYSNSGPVTVINTGSIHTSGGPGSTGISAVSYFGDVVVRSGSVAVTGAGSRGIYAASTASVTVESASLTLDAENATPRAALFAVGYNATDVKSGSIVTSGTNSGAMEVQSIGGNATVVSGSIETHGKGGFGVFGEQFYDGLFSLDSGTVTTFADGSVAINVIAPDGAIVIRSGTVVTHGAASTGITTRYTENGVEMTAGTGVNITSNSVSTSGQASDGIVADSVGGAVVVTSGSVETLGAGSRGIIANSTNGSVVVTSGDVRTGGGDAIVLSSGTGSQLTSTGLIDAAGGLAVRATGGAATIVNSGQMIGAVSLTDNADTFTNSGTFRAIGDSEFGGGADRFTNSGILMASGRVAFGGLETFSNTGLIDLRNGHAGDELVLPGTFAGDGASALAIDVAFAPPSGTSTADTLSVAGEVTGSTALLIDPVGANGAILSPGVVFATGGAGSSPGAFRISDESRDRGFIHYSIAYNSATGAYSVVGTPGDSVLRTLKINEAAQQLWYRSADAWSAHVRDADDRSERGLWGAVFGQSNSRETAQTDTTFGQSRVVGLSYNQDTFGGQLGFGLGGSALRFGITGGYLSSDLNFLGSADGARYSVANIGAYAGFTARTVFANALVKYDHDWIESRSPTAGYIGKLQGDSYGADGELGFRFGGRGFRAEPVGTIAYVHTNLPDLRALGATINFAPLDGLRGKAGLRLAGSADIRGAAAVFYAQGDYVHEFAGKDGIAFSSGGYTIAYPNRPIGDYVEGKLGLTIASHGGITGFIEGFGDFSGNYRGGGGRAGLRISL